MVGEEGGEKGPAGVLRAEEDGVEEDVDAGEHGELGGEVGRDVLEKLPVGVIGAGGEYQIGVESLAAVS